MRIRKVLRPNVESISNQGLTLLLGGARSGKSSLAVDIASRTQREVVFIATAQALDADMQERIARHQRERPKWLTFEEPFDITSAIKNAPSSACIIIDCLTLWVSNLMMRETSEQEISSACTKSLSAISQRNGKTIVISNEVGLGVVPETALGREYREILGRVNHQWARAARQSLFLIAGKAFPLHDPQEILQ